MSGFFSGSNPIFRFTGRVLDVIVLSALWLFCSLGIVTIGPATAALYYSCAKCLRRGEPGAYSSFFHAFRLNLRTGAAATAVWLIAALILDAVYLFFTMGAQAEGGGWALARVVYCVLLLLPLGALCLTFPLLSRFTYTAGSLLANAFRLTIRHLPRILALAAVNLVLAVVTVWGWYYGLMLLTPAIAALASTFLLEPLFRRYTPVEETEEGVETPWYLR